MNARLTFIHALSPLHAGTGQGVGVIDLPIAREKATGLPYLPGSSLKGVLRDACELPTLRVQVFGPDTSNASDHAGSVRISDQRLLLLPIRSVAGTFAWVTSPYVLLRLMRDAQMTGTRECPSDVPAPTATGCLVSGQGSQIRVGNKVMNKVILEDLDLDVAADECTTAWAEWIGERVFPGNATWQGMLHARICVVHDDVLTFLLNTATEITARIKLQEGTKTVQKGGLWYEESLPTETILFGMAVATPVKAEFFLVFETLASLMGQPLQLGGKTTVGRGLCRIQMAEGS